MVHFSCSHASWREDIVPDLSLSTYKSTRVGDGIPILETAPSSHGIYFNMIHVPCQYSHREIRPARVAERPGRHPTAAVKDLEMRVPRRSANSSIRPVPWIPLKPLYD